MHDTVEDYDVPFDEIARFAGSNVANSVFPVTVPKTKELMRRYPELVTKIPAGVSPLVRAAEEKRVKRALKYRFKQDSTANYTADNVILRLFDNKDTLEAYTRNMELGQIHITMDKTKADKDGPPPVFWYDDLAADYVQRLIASRLLYKRCAELNEDWVMNPEGLDCISMVQDFRAMMAPVGRKFLDAMRISAETYDKAPFTRAIRSDDALLIAARTGTFATEPL